MDEKMLEETHHGRERAGDKTSERTHDRVKTSFVMGSMVGNRNSDGSFDRSKLGNRLRRYDQRKISSQKKSQIKGITAVKMLRHIQIHLSNKDSKIN